MSSAKRLACLTLDAEQMQHAYYGNLAPQMAFQLKCNQGG